MLPFILQILATCLIAVKSKEVEFTILHNNDLHSRFDEISAGLGTCTEELKSSNKCFGGFARAAHM